MMGRPGPPSNANYSSNILVNTNEIEFDCGRQTCLRFYFRISKSRTNQLRERQA